MAVAAGQCPQPTVPISTDRPSTTPSSTVVPWGSLQSENGVELTDRSGATVFDATESRLRLGVVPCLEVLVDIPTYFVPVRGQASSGFSNVAPALKWQVTSGAGAFDLSVIAGVGLPTGAPAIVGPGVQPYLQVVWSHDLGGSWTLSSMLESVFTPADSMSKFAGDVTLDVGRSIGDRFGLFVEYVGGYPAAGGSSQLVDGGATYVLTPTQQLDLHVGVGLNRNAPNWVFGVGYSFRLDRLFGSGRH